MYMYNYNILSCRIIVIFCLQLLIAFISYLGHIWQCSCLMPDQNLNKWSMIFISFTSHLLFEFWWYKDVLLQPLYKIVKKLTSAKISTHVLIFLGATHEHTDQNVVRKLMAPTRVLTPNVQTLAGEKTIALPKKLVVAR